MSDSIGLLILLIPLLIAFLNYMDKLQKEKHQKPLLEGTSQPENQKFFIQRIGWIPIVIFLLYLVFIALGIKSLTDTGTQKQQYQSTVDNLTYKSDSLKNNGDSLIKDVKVLRKQNDSLYKLLVSVNQKFDTTSRFTGLSPTIADATLNFCNSDSNLVLKEISPNFFRIPVQFCSGNATLNDV